VGLAVNAAMGQSCCRFFCPWLAPADGARVARRRSQREFSRLAAGLRSKVRERHSDEANAFRRREYGPDQGPSLGMSAAARYRTWTIEIASSEGLQNSSPVAACPLIPNIVRLGSL
jgi:hypothetical protein